MVELSNEFMGCGEVKGFHFKKIESNDFAFIYEVKSIGEENQTKVWYEVFERKISKESDGMIHGVKIHFEEREVYPTSNSFGKWAWCINNYDDAICKFNLLSSKIDKKVLL